MRGGGPGTGKLGDLMKATVEPVEGNKVKLSVTVEAVEFEPAIAAAWQSI